MVVNGKDLNRLEANALDRSRAFKRLRLRWPQRERGVADEERQFLENGVGNTCASAVRAHSSAPPAAWNVPADRGPSFLNEQGISPSNEGQQDGIELAAFFGQKIFVNPRRLPRRHFLQHPKTDHFLQPRGEQRFRQAQRRLDFSISAELEETLIQYQQGPTVPDHRQCSTQGRGCSVKAFHFIGPRPASIPSRWNRSAAALTNRCLVSAASVLSLFILRPPSGGTPGRTATSLLTHQIILCFRCPLYSKFRTRPARMTRPNCARR